MPPTIRHKYQYFHSTVQGAKDRRQKFHFCRLPFDVRPRNVKLNLSSSLHLGRKYARIFVLGQYLFLVGKTVCFSEQIMFANKYPSIFSRQVATIVYIIPRQKHYIV